MRAFTEDYRPPAWLPGPHAQTIYPALFAPRPSVAYRRSLWPTPDGDAVAVDDAAAVAPPAAPTVVLLHGLEGDSSGHYARSLVAAAVGCGWRARVIHWRGCGGVPVQAPRAYHSGDSDELDWMLERAAREAGGAVFVVGISLGGNVLVKWLGERGRSAAARVHAAAAVSVPFSLAAGASTLARGFGRVYTRHFLATMRPKALALLARHPGLFDRSRMLAADTLYDFDDCFTAPVHGFRSADDYYARSSAGPFAGGIGVPTLLVSARNDPFLPATHLPDPRGLPADVQAFQTDQGGHAGFCQGAFPGGLDWLPAGIIRFFDSIRG